MALSLESKWVIVFCDVILGEIDGYTILRQFSEIQPEAKFVLMTGHGSAAGALDATAAGALDATAAGVYDYLIKPFTVDDILNIARLVGEEHQHRSNPEPESSTLDYTSDTHLIGKSPKFIECLKMVGRVAATDLPILITGESGTGKEVIARAIHQRSNHASGAFIAVNCGAIPIELIELEIFGDARGSFGGANRERTGLWDAAEGGTLFLDEITETDSHFQSKLLLALQQQEICRCGSARSKKTDVRIIAATNRDIEEEVRENHFRQDLLYCLNAITVALPPLRERKADIALLAGYFAGKIRPPGAAPVKFSGIAMEMLNNYGWIGNVRELENAVLYAVSICDDIVCPENLPPRIRNFSNYRTMPSDVPKLSNSMKRPLPTMAEIEQNYVAEILASTGGNKQAAARILHIDRKTLSRTIHRTAAGT